MRFGDWISVSSFHTCYKVLDELLGNYNDIKYEVPLRMPSLFGSLDAELKCVQKLKDEHIIQLGFYVAMYIHVYKVVTTAILCNLFTSEIIELHLTQQRLESYILEYESIKQKANIQKSDDEFIVDCSKLVERIYAFQNHE